MNILEVELLSDNLAETEKFYKRVLGISSKWSATEAIWIQIGYTKLIFRHSENKKPVYHFAIDLPTNRFFDALHAIKQHVPILPVEDGEEVANFTAWDAKSFYFYDNNGNILECVTRYPNKAYLDEPFSSKAFISISEIGLVTNNVPQLADTLTKEFGVPLFKRQPRSDSFTVSGDDHGLFIIGAKGRDWYPTQVKSQSFRTRVIFIDNGSIGHIIR